MASSLAALSSLRRMPSRDWMVCSSCSARRRPRLAGVGLLATPLQDHILDRANSSGSSSLALLLSSRRRPRLRPPSRGPDPGPRLGPGALALPGRPHPLRPSQPRSRPQADRDDRFCGVRLTQRVSQHGTDGRHRNREPASNQSRFSIQPSAPPIPHESRRSAAAVARTGSDNPAPDRGRGRRSQDGALRKAARR